MLRHRRIKERDPLEGGMYRNSLSACARETVHYAPALSAGAFVRLNHAPQLPRETRFARPGDRRAAKHRRLRSLRAKVAPQVRHYSAEGRCALAIKIGGNAAMEPLRRIFQCSSSIRISATIWICFNKLSVDSICGSFVFSPTAPPVSDHVARVAEIFFRVPDYRR